MNKFTGKQTEQDTPQLGQAKIDKFTKIDVGFKDKERYGYSGINALGDSEINNIKALSEKYRKKDYACVTGIMPGLLNRPGIKYDDNKTMFDLLPSMVLENVADVFTYGAVGKKGPNGKPYDRRNWENGIRYGRVFAALNRHLWKWWRGKDFDSESGLHHLAHMITNGMFLLHYALHDEQYSKDFDDRPMEEK